MAHRKLLAGDMVLNLQTQRNGQLKLANQLLDGVAAVGDFHGSAALRGEDGVHGNAEGV